MLDRRSALSALLWLSLSAACATPSQEPAPAREAHERLAARLEAIFASKEFTPRAFGPARWSDGASYLTLEESATHAGASDLVRCDAASGATSVLIAAEELVPTPGAAPLVIEDYAFSADATRVLLFTNTQRVWRYNTRGDYWVLDRKQKTLKKLGGDGPESALQFAKFSPDATRVAYVREHDLWVEELESGAIWRLTSDGSPTSINGTSDWVYEEEFDLRDAFRWSPDGKDIAFWHFDSTGVESFTLINDTDTTYPVTHTIPYPKAGTTNSAVTIGVVPAAGGEPRWLALPGDPREMYVPRAEWVPATGELLVQQMNRRQNRNTVWLADAASGAAREFFAEEDRTAWLDVVDDWSWFEGGRELLWISEKDGWRHAWAVSKGNGAWRCLTPGEFDLQGIVGVEEGHGEEHGTLYFLASPGDATRRYLYSVPLAGGAPERLTPAAQLGTHTYDLAPGGAFALHTVSGLDRPPAVDLVRLPGHERVRALETNDELVARLASLIPRPTEFFQVEIEPGVRLDGWMMRPADFDPARSYPLVMHCYNEPSNVQANDVWRGPRGLFHHALAEAGYVVACVDTQGTAGPRGRDWRKATYQRFGPVGADQQAAAVRALCAERSYLDPSRVCSWGWSGGGTMTLNLMFRHPDVYQVGMAVAPVPDVALYDSVYQERYTGLPATDAEAYRINSPITYAEGLRGKLLLVHGSGDDNVHFQGSERLINRLVALGKPFDFMLYPNRTHSISEGQGTSLHVYSLLARYLEEHLPVAR